MPRLATEIGPENRNEAAVLGFFTNLMTGDLDAFARIWTEDAVQEHPLRLQSLTVSLNGREENVPDYRRMFAGGEDMVFTIKHMHTVRDMECVIVETSGRSRVTETGGIYDQNDVAIFKLRDGQISLNCFCFNPLVTQQAFAGVLTGHGISKQDG